LAAARIPSDPQIALAEGKKLLSQGKRDEAVAHLMHTFSEGSPDVRQEASRVLEELGEMNTDFG
jgi:thioredoxin-like negative regulator of GroEL